MTVNPSKIKHVVTEVKAIPATKRGSAKDHQEEEVVVSES